MAYISTTELSQRLGATLYARLTDRVNGTTADEAVAQQLISAAEAEADGYFARRYATPVDLAVYPELAQVLNARVLDVAEYLAWCGSPFIGNPPQRVQALYAAALRWLEDVAGGQLVLPAASPPPSAVAHADEPRHVSSARVLTADELDGL